jgi:hypothetical protein
MDERPTPSRCRILWQSLLAVFIILAVAVVLTSRTLAGREEMICEGMTQAEVEAILGPPSDISTFNYGRDVKALTWREDPVTVLVCFDGTGVQGVIGQQVGYTGKPNLWWRIRRHLEKLLPAV